MASPRGRAAALRTCTQCGLKGRVRDAFYHSKAICRGCSNAADAVRRRAHKQRRAQQRATANGQHRAVIRRTRGVFDASVRALEVLWGAYATWTRQQHEAHSAWLRQRAGIPERPAQEAA